MFVVVYSFLAGSLVLYLKLPLLGTCNQLEEVILLFGSHAYI